MAFQYCIELVKNLNRHIFAFHCTVAWFHGHCVKGEGFSVDAFTLALSLQFMIGSQLKQVKDILMRLVTVPDNHLY